MIIPKGAGDYLPGAFLSVSLRFFLNPPFSYRASCLFMFHAFHIYFIKSIPFNNQFFLFSSMTNPEPPYHFLISYVKIPEPVI